MSGPQPGTPTPWAWYKMAYGEARGLCGPDGQFVIDPVCEVGDYGLSVTNSLEVNEQDAAAIVHRMNNWDAVVEALEAVIGSTMGGKVAGGDGDTYAIYPPSAAVLAKASAALTLAKSGGNS